jgi:hypothetical protein
MRPEERLAQLGLLLPDVPKPVANYVPFSVTATRPICRGKGRAKPTARSAEM